MHKQWHISPSSLSGKLLIPPSKSHTLRALTFALMAKGTSEIRNFLPSPDTAAMIQAIRYLGASVATHASHITVQGTGGKIQSAENVIDCGNSGQVLRFIGALAGLLPTYTILTGDASIRHNRPVQPLLDGLSQLGAFALSSRQDGYAPIIIRGPLAHARAFITGEDSQPVSGLLIASAFAPHPIELIVSNLGELPWIHLTLHWLDKLHIPYSMQPLAHSKYRFVMQGGKELPAFHYSVPGDFSSAAFPIGAAVITDSELFLEPIDMEDPQGDKEIISVLQKMGAKLEICPKTKTLHVQKGSRLQGCRIDCNQFVDALPILSVIGCFAEGTTELVNAAIARKKESDRIHCMAMELKKMGAHIEELEDGLRIHRSVLKGVNLEGHHDHRIVLSLAVAALAAKGSSTIQGVDAALKTYPSFFADFRSLGAHIEATS